jgi:hypothetical protein
MTREELAQKLNGREYRDELNPEEEQEAKNAGLVVVFGASDDLMELRGAIDDELGCYEGGTAYFDKNGLLENKCDDEDCPYFKEKVQQAKSIDAEWNDKGNPCWTYKTYIPHLTFEITEDAELYCIGIVFSINDLKNN